MIKLSNLRDSHPGPAPNTVKSGERLPLTSEGFGADPQSVRFSYTSGGVYETAWGHIKGAKDCTFVK